jgi:uncharacterized protein with HEPN domain
VPDDGFLLDMLVAAREALASVEGVTWERFAEDRMLHTFVTHQIQVIGEAATGITPAFQQAHPEIAWTDITGMRHKIVHDYRDVDLEVVWSTATDSLPELIALLEPLVPPED